MVISAEQERVKSLIVDTVSLLCKNGLHYSKEFAIEGLLGITLDKDDVFLVSIKEIIKSETYEGSDGDSDAKSDTRKSKRRKRKKRRANTDANESDSDVSDADNSTVADNASLHSESIEPPSKRLAVKQEEEANDDDDDDLVFIKDEPGVDLSQCSFSQVDSGAQANSVIGDLHQQGLFATPAQQQPQPHSQPWNNTPHPGGGADAFQSPTTSTSQQMTTILRGNRLPPSSPLSSSLLPPQQQGPPWMCPICAQSYSTKSHLKRHMDSHAGRYPYTCPECGKGSTNPTRMKEHLTIHTGVNYFECKRGCGQSFRFKDQLKRHGFECSGAPSAVVVSVGSEVGGANVNAPRGVTEQAASDDNDSAAVVNILPRS